VVDKCGNGISHSYLCLFGMGLYMVSEETEMMLTFTFTLNPETQEATFAGNIEIQVALQILQQLTLAEMVRRSKDITKEELKDGNNRRTMKEVRTATSQDKAGEDN
jgi:hypothetical protein